MKITIKNEWYFLCILKMTRSLVLVGKRHAKDIYFNVDRYVPQGHYVDISQSYVAFTCDYHLSRLYTQLEYELNYTKHAVRSDVTFVLYRLLYNDTNLATRYDNKIHIPLRHLIKYKTTSLCKLSNIWFRNVIGDVSMSLMLTNKRPTKKFVHIEVTGMECPLYNLNYLLWSLHKNKWLIVHTFDDKTLTKIGKETPTVTCDKFRKYFNMESYKISSKYYISEEFPRIKYIDSSNLCYVLALHET